MPKKDKQKEEDMKITDDTEDTDDTKDTKETKKQAVEQTSEEEKTNDPLKKGDKNYSDMKEKVQDAVEGIVDSKIEKIPLSDMITEALQKALEPLIEDMKTVTEIAKNHDSKKSVDLVEILQKEPYEFEKDFLEGKSLIELQSTKDTYEASKTYKDFVATQEEANKPNKEIFGKAGKMEDFVEYGAWDHLYKESK